MVHAAASSLGREDLHALFLNVPWPVAVFSGPTHVVELVNDAFMRIAGDSRGVVVGRPFRAVFPDLEAQGLSALLDRVFASGETFVRTGFRAQVSRPDGPYEGYWDVTIQPLRGADGQVAGLLASTIEVTERVRTVERVKVLADAGLLLDAELDLDRTLQNLADLLVPRLADYCIVDLVEGDRLRRVLTAHADPEKRDLVARLRAFEPDLSDPTGVGKVLTRDEPLLAASIRPEELDAAARGPEHGAILRALDARSSILFPLRTHGPALGLLTVAFAESGRRYTDADLQLVGDLARRAALAISTARSVRAERRAAEIVAERERQAKIAEQRKDEFLAMLGHELRNPLSPIQVGVELIRRKAGQVVERECAILDRQVAHLTRLLDDLLDVARITRGKTELRRERQDLGPVIERAVEIVRPQIDARRHELCVGPLEPGLRVDIDPVRIAQVISNLLTNAARYTPPGGRIDLHAGREGDRAFVRVRDNGAGIPEHMLSAVFELFVQGERGLDRSEGGLGVGLTLARSVVEMHGGSIEARSEGSGRGSEFTVHLPLCD